MLIDIGVYRVQQPSLSSFVCGFLTSRPFPGRNQYKDVGMSGDAVAYAVANHDLMGCTAYSEIELPKLHVLAHTIVNYRGHRLTCQSIIAGIFHDQTSEHLYGTMDNGRTVKCDPAFHSLMVEAGRKLHIAEHPVYDEAGNEVSISTSFECKGMTGSDRRKYILDVTRAFPRDANFPDYKVRCERSVPLCGRWRCGRGVRLRGRILCCARARASNH